MLYKRRSRFCSPSPLRDSERWCLSEGVRTLPCGLTSMDGKSPILTSRAAALLGAFATALHRRIINVCAVARIDSDVLQDFAFRADIEVLLGYVGELVDAVEISRPIWRTHRQGWSVSSELTSAWVWSLSCGPFHPQAVRLGHIYSAPTDFRKWDAFYSVATNVINAVGMLSPPRSSDRAMLREYKCAWLGWATREGMKVETC